MSTRVQLPSIGESVSQAQIATWVKKVGDFVKEGEVLCILETDKVGVDLPSPKSGVLLELLWNEGDTLSVGDDLCVIDESGSATGTKNQETDPTNVESVTHSGENSEQVVKEQDSFSHAMPSAAKMAREEGVNLESVQGTGKGGRITKSDVREFLSKSPAPPAGGSVASEASVSVISNPTQVATGVASAGERREPMSNLRKTIAKRLKEAQNTAASLTTFNEVDLGVLSEIRAEHRGDFEKTHGVRLGFMSFFVKAAAHALQAFPVVNARIDGSDIVYSDLVDIGVAVSTDSGLIVPVLRDAASLSLAGIEKQIAFYADKARKGTIALSDIRGGTFTITNGGVFGSMMSTPILNPPQSAILGMHRIEKRPVVVGDKIEVRPMMYLALSYDHRIIDGKEAVMFLQTIKSVLEDPHKFLLGIS